MSQSSSSVPAAIIGAGPYGLSVAAHLNRMGVDYRIFGRPMASWIENMPDRMFLKSAGFASNLSDGTGYPTMARFAGLHRREFEPDDWPVPIDLFRDYGLWFQQAFVGGLEPHDVVDLLRAGTRFELRLSDGERVLADQVVLAVGLTHYAHVPTALRGLPRDLVTHTVDHRDFAPFAGRKVTVIGGGQSALQSAALLQEAGAEATVLVRGDRLAWVGDPVQRSLWYRLRYPRNGLGPGMKTYLYAKAPHLFRHLPQERREQIVKGTLGPAGAWWLRPRFVGKVAVTLDTVVQSVTPHREGLQLEVVRGGGLERHTTDHVIAGTGFRPDITRIPFLHDDLLERIQRSGTVPVLDATFESSVPGLYFVGLTAAQTFGPVQRFVCGADFTARRVSRNIARQVGRSRLAVSVPGEPALSA